MTSPESSVRPRETESRTPCVTWDLVVRSPARQAVWVEIWVDERATSRIPDGRDHGRIIALISQNRDCPKCQQHQAKDTDGQSNTDS